MGRYETASHTRNLVTYFIDRLETLRPLLFWETPHTGVSQGQTDRNACMLI